MATIRPFRGIRYNPEKIDDLSSVISQPYDRVRYGLQDKYYEQSDYTIVKIIKGREYPEDSEKDNVYTRARNYLQTWLQDGVLQVEDQPAIYVLHQSFTLLDGTPYTRKGFICAFELSRFDEGVILPHERTLSGPKVDRHKLATTAQAYFGSIFMLYPDDENTVNAILDAAVAEMEPVEFEELFESEIDQKFWVVTDPDVIAAVEREMAPKKNLIIADGHHRYETALTIRNEMRTLYPQAPADAAFNYRMAMMVSMSDPGLVILPTHRLIHSYTAKTSQQILEEAKAYFDIKSVSDRDMLEEALAEALPEKPRIGFYDGSCAVLTLRDAAVMEKFAPDHEAGRTLDVSILHNLLIEGVMGLSHESVERKENVDYLRDPDMGYENVARGEANFLFLLNPTRMEQVRACALAAEMMPQKSTDFYPKIVSGLAAMSIRPDERI
ncbi:MAG: DUF1015 domain-containing protein [Anaerolineales bacterium]|nr:DUF1015 domain-containing protein [Anaerolineales bacterium]